MILKVLREPSVNGMTPGRLFVGDHFECFTLEDEIREQDGVKVADWKIVNHTAIPSGTYRVIITKSNRFQRLLPELMNVPGFAGIRIHPGNVAADTSGCLLVGRIREEDSIRESKLAFEALFAQLEQATEAVWITIKNPIPHGEIRQA